MQQILKFNIKLYDIRNNNFVSIIDDTSIVKGIRVHKDSRLNNITTISFYKEKIYKTRDLENYLRLYNYAKIELVLTNSSPSFEKPVTSNFYFSGFITSINRASNLSDNPFSSINIQISDYSTLMKTTFYTKNLVFLDILQQAIPELRLLNISQVFGEDSEKLLDSFWDPNQIGFIFFSFFYYKFLYKIMHDDKGNHRSNIFKRFKVFMPFSFDDKSSIFAKQVTSLQIYRQLQGVAWDLYKYIFPDPIFDFNTHETEDSSILIIRPYPYMSFRRDVTKKVNVSAGDFSGEGVLERDYVIDKFEANTYDLIDYKDFGFKNVINNKDNIIDKIKSKNEDSIKIINDSLKFKSTFNVNELIPMKGEELDNILDTYFKIKKFDTSLIETINVSRSASAVVNIVWTTPVTQTAVINSSGRALVYYSMNQQMTDPKKAPDFFKNYLIDQYLKFSDDKKDSIVNPAFFWNYQNSFQDKLVSGDIGYFGIREFEVKWNFLNIYDTSASNILKYISQNRLKQLKDSTNNDAFKKILGAFISSDDSKVNKKSTAASYTFPKFSQDPYDVLSKSRIAEEEYKNIIARFSDKKIQKNQRDELKKATSALKDSDYISSLKQSFGSDFKIISPDNISDEKIFSLLKRIIEGSESILDAVNDINYVISKSYRENEHLYSGVISTVVDLSIYPTQILELDNSRNENTEIILKGYVESIDHIIDFSTPSMKTLINVDRSAYADSAVSK